MIAASSGGVFGADELLLQLLWERPGEVAWVLQALFCLRQTLDGFFCSLFQNGTEIYGVCSLGSVTLPVICRGYCLGYIKPWTASLEFADQRIV